MSQQSAHSFADKDSRPSSSLSFHTYSTYNSPSPPRSLSPDPEPVLEHPLDHTQSHVDTTSFLGSVWNLVKDAKDFAAKELDRFLDNIPYKHSAGNAHETPKDSIRLVRQHRVSKSMRQPVSTLVGHGLHPSSRHAIARKRILATKVLDQDTAAYFQSLASLNNNSTTLSNATSSKSVPGVAQFSRSNSLPIIPRKRHAPSHPPVSISSQQQPSMAYRSSILEESDGWESPRTNVQDEDESDASELFHERQQKRRSRAVSRANSETPSITTIAGGMSISEDPILQPHRQHQPHHHSRTASKQLKNRLQSDDLYQHRRRHGARTHTHSEDGGHFPRTATEDSVRRNMRHSPMDYTNALSQSIYPRPRSRHGSISEAEDHPLSKKHPVHTISNNSTPRHSGRASPSLSFGDETSLLSTPPKQVTEVASSTADNERFNKLQQELAVIKEQLASLVSARQEDIQRARSDVLLPGTPPPPPPPPPPPTSSSSSTSTSVPGLILAKKWSIPQSEAALSMQSVLNELSSSTRRLRQTDSPFLKEAKAKAPLDSTDSIISQLVDDGSAQDSSSYPTTPTPIRRSGVSRTNPTTPTPIRRSGVSSAIPTFETLGSTTLLSRTASTPSTEKKQAIMTDAEMELRWPSPGTIHRADARLDSVAAKLKHPFNIQKRSASTMETKTMTRPDEPPPPARSLSVGMNGGGRNSAGATVPKTSMHVRSGPMMDNSQTKQRPVPQRSSNQLHRSQTDPTRQTFDARKDHRQLQAAKDKQQQEQQQASLIDPSLTIESTSVNSDIRAAKVAAEQDHERKWYLESDMDSWRVST